jgi:hypothetical protein
MHQHAPLKENRCRGNASAQRGLEVWVDNHNLGVELDVYPLTICSPSL